MLTILFSLAWHVNVRAISRHASPVYISPRVTSSALAVPMLDNKAALAAGPAFPRTWVPIASTWELDPNRPTPVSFLGQRYIAYRDNKEQWVVMDDACPHRLAPLSEGRVDRENDRIECGYHGWAFNSSGACERIPQATERLAATAASSARACVASLPTQVVCSVLWVWPWDEDCLSVAGEPGAHPEGMLEGVDPDSTTYTRDLPYGWDTLLENIVDPSHIPFAHHGLQGKRDDAIAINMSVPTLHGARGFSFEFGDRTMGKRRTGTGEFRAPYVVKYDATFEPTPTNAATRPFKLAVICVPTKPGWSRAIIFSASRPKQASSQTKPPPKQSLVSRLIGLLPVWMLHLGSNRFLDSDLAFLHYQEQSVRERGGDAMASYYMPAPTDRCIAALRKWIVTFAHVPGPLPPPIYTRSILFDRWTQHTSHCVHCQAALQSFAKWRRNAYALLAAAILGFQWWPARLVGLASVGLLWLLAALEPAFRVNDYKHYLSR